MDVDEYRCNVGAVRERVWTATRCTPLVPARQINAGMSFLRIRNVGFISRLKLSRLRMVPNTTFLGISVSRRPFPGIRVVVILWRCGMGFRIACLDLGMQRM